MGNHRRSGKRASGSPALTKGELVSPEATPQHDRITAAMAPLRTLLTPEHKGTRAGFRDAMEKLNDLVEILNERVFPTRCTALKVFKAMGLVDLCMGLSIRALYEIGHQRLLPNDLQPFVRFVHRISGGDTLSTLTREELEFTHAFAVTPTTIVPAVLHLGLHCPTMTIHCAQIVEGLMPTLLSKLPSMGQFPQHVYSMFINLLDLSDNITILRAVLSAILRVGPCIWARGVRGADGYREGIASHALKVSDKCGVSTSNEPCPELASLLVLNRAYFLHPLAGVTTDFRKYASTVVACMMLDRLDHDMEVKLQILTVFLSACVVRDGEPPMKCISALAHLGKIVGFVICHQARCATATLFGFLDAVLKVAGCSLAEYPDHQAVIADFLIEHAAFFASPVYFDGSEVRSFVLMSTACADMDSERRTSTALFDALFATAGAQKIVDTAVNSLLFGFKRAQPREHTIGRLAILINTLALLEPGSVCLGKIWRSDALWDELYDFILHSNDRDLHPPMTAIEFLSLVCHYEEGRRRIFGMKFLDIIGSTYVLASSHDPTTHAHTTALFVGLALEAPEECLRALNGGDVARWREWLGGDRLIFKSSSLVAMRAYTMALLLAHQATYMKPATSDVQLLEADCHVLNTFFCDQYDAVLEFLCLTFEVMAEQRDCNEHTVAMMVTRCQETRDGARGAEATRAVANNVLAAVELAAQERREGTKRNPDC